MTAVLKPLLLSTLLATSIAFAAGKAYMGFEVHYTLKRSAFDAKLDRVVVTKVQAHSPAKRAGLQPDDVVEQLNGSIVSGQSARKLDNVMNNVRPGETVRLTVLRSGKRVLVSIVAAERS